MQTVRDPAFIQRAVGASHGTKAALLIAGVDATAMFIRASAARGCILLGHQQSVLVETD